VLLGAKSKRPVDSPEFFFHREAKLVVSASAILAAGVALLMVLAVSKLRGVGLGRGWEENPFPSRNLGECEALCLAANSPFSKSFSLVRD
jgi:hypothetical protein